MLRRVLGREADVRVVRQEDDLVGRQLRDRLEQFRRRRVRRLATLDDPDGPDGRGDAFEEFAVPLPRDDRDDTAGRTLNRVWKRRRVGDRGESPLALLLLHLHVRDLDPFDRPDGGAERERGAGIVGVHVHLERRLVANDEERVAEQLELRLEAVAVETVALDHEDGAVAVARLLEMDCVEAGTLRRYDGRLRHWLARDSRREAAQELDKTGAARVHDTRLAEHLEQLRRARDRFLATPDKVDEELAERGRVGGAALGLLGQLAHDSQHRSLDRPAHGAVRRVGGATQGARGEHRLDAVRRPPEHVGGAAHDLGEDHARVAARAHQRRAGDLVGEGRTVRRLRAAEGLGDGAHGEREVCARIPVGDGIDVEIVDPHPARLERTQCRADEDANPIDIGRGAHFPLLADALTASTCTSTASTDSPVSRSTSYAIRFRTLAATSARLRPYSTTTWRPTVTPPSGSRPTSIPRACALPRAIRPRTERFIPTTP